MIRAARSSDLAVIAEVEKASWPAGMASDQATLAARLAAFPPGQLVAEVAGRVIAYAGAQRISSQLLTREPLTFAVLTDGSRFTRSHVSDGDTFQLIGVAVLPTERGSGIARALIDFQIDQARQMPHVRRIVGFTRPAKYYRNKDVPIEEYVKKRDANGQLIDPVVAFHLNAGAKLISIHPAFRPEDTEAQGYGVLIEYPVKTSSA